MTINVHFAKKTAEKEVKQLNKMEDKKSPGNSGFTKEFYETFCDHVKVSLLLYFKMTFLIKELCTSKKKQK